MVECAMPYIVAVFIYGRFVTSWLWQLAQGICEEPQAEKGLALTN
jgi:hypothetical protein